MENLKQIIAGLFLNYEEGLATQLEVVRQIIDESIQQYNKLNVCGVCGAVNEGHHMEGYSGLTCPSCIPENEKKLFRVLTVKNAVAHEECRYNWELFPTPNVNQFNFADIVEMNVGGTFRSSGDDDTITFITRLS